MTPIHAQLIARIQREGPITFAAFMEAALYDPEHGYYASGRARIGAGGDFHTAVSVGPLFGALLARQFIQMWELLGHPQEWSLVEQGAFDGQLAEDVLTALQNFSPACFDATTLHVVEPLALLQERQTSKLSQFKDHVVWHRDLESLPSFCGVHYSNELLDAFPVHRLRFTSEGWRELRVDTSGKTLVWVETEITDDAVKGATRHLCDREAGAFGEVCVGYAPHLKAVGAKLKNGWMLALDYGMSGVELALPIRRDGTISSYREQRRMENLLANPGEQDLTAHVNFSTLAIQAVETGWTLEGYTEQNRFFTGLAPHHFRDATAALTREDQRELLAFRTLTHPQLMGFQFKAFCLGRQGETGSAGGEEGLPGGLSRLCGFGLAQNPRNALMLQEASFR